MQPRDPRTGKFVSSSQSRVNNNLKRLPFVLWMTGYLLAMGYYGPVAGTALVIVLTVMYVATRTMITVLRKDVAERHATLRDAMDRRGLTAEAAAVELRRYNEVDGFGHCMTCGAYADAHVNARGQVMTPNDYHVSIDDDHWEEVQEKYDRLWNISQSIPVDTPSPATVRALGAAQPASDTVWVTGSNGQRVEMPASRVARTTRDINQQSLKSGAFLLCQNCENGEIGYERYDTVPQSESVYRVCSSCGERYFFEPFASGEPRPEPQYEPDGTQVPAVGAVTDRYDRQIRAQRQVPPPLIG